MTQEFRPEVVNHLEEMVSKISDPNQKGLWIKGKQLTVNELYKEFKDRTEIGIYFYEIVERHYDILHNHKDK